MQVFPYQFLKLSVCSFSTAQPPYMGLKAVLISPTTHLNNETVRSLVYSFLHSG